MYQLAKLIINNISEKAMANSSENHAEGVIETASAKSAVKSIMAKNNGKHIENGVIEA